MRNFNQNKRQGGGGRKFDRRDSGGRGRDFNRPPMHHAVCDECGRDCEVPFRPTGDKPIFCSECFQGKKGGSSDRFDKRPSFREKKMYTTVCFECGKNCEVPFKPTGDKPVYCDECFGKGGGKSQKGGSDFDKKFEILNAKLDKVLEALGSGVSEKKAVKKEKNFEPKEVAKKKSKKSSVKKVATKKTETKKETPKKASKKTAAKKTAKKK